MNMCANGSGSETSNGHEKPVSLAMRDGRPLRLRLLSSATGNMIPPCWTPIDTLDLK